MQYAVLSVRIGLRRGIVGETRDLRTITNAQTTLGQAQVGLPHNVSTPLSRTIICETKNHGNSELVRLRT